MQLGYLENLVRYFIFPELQVFDSHAMSQILSIADVREPPRTGNVTNTYKLLPQKIRGWQ